MRRIQSISRVVVAAVCLCSVLVSQQLPVRVAAAGTPSLVISQLKITSSNGQFVTLYNATNTALDMSKYQLEYFNNYDLSKSTSSRLIALSGIVPPHGYFMINDNAMLLCYQLTVNAASLGFSSTAGMVAIVSMDQTSPGGLISPQIQDYVGWSKTTAAGAQTLPSSTSAFLLRQPLDAGNNPIINSAGAGSWQQVQPDATNPCKLTTVGSSPTAVLTGMNQLLAATSDVPASIVSTASVGQATPSIPASDIGLKPPSVSELLPNPSGTGNDKTDEFIELYNPNDASFDLTGFILQTGLTKNYNYVLPAGTKIAGKAFLAVYSKDSNVTLSNTSSQARLLDPFGNTLTTSGVYNAAKDGQAWASAKSQWYWTATPTPGKANVIKEPTSSKSKKSNSKVKGAATKKGATGAVASSGSFQEEPSTAPIHTWILVLIGGLALLYGAYEYRADVANKVHQLRRNFTARRTNRS